MDRSTTSPQESKTYAFPQHGVVKRAGLLFDRLQPADLFARDIPEEIQFYVPEAHNYFKQAQRKVLRRFMKGHHPKPGYTLSNISDICRDSSVQTLVESHRHAGFYVLPVYDHQRQFLADFPSGSSIVYQAALSNLPDVIEETASWDQILDFRKDKDALRKYRALRLWLHNALITRSVEEATDVICLKVEDYEWALRKHGFKTATGAISSILDWKGLTTIIGGSSLAAVVGGPIWSALTAGFVISARISVWVAERMIEKKEIERGDGVEVAVIYEAKKRFARKKRTT